MCAALKILRRSMDQRGGAELTHSVHRMHKQARSLATRVGEEPSTLSDLLFAIGQAVKGWTFDVTPETVTSDKGIEVYSVTINDLKVVVAAIDSTFPHTVDEAYQVFKQARGVGVEIPKPSRLSEFYVRAYQHQLRQVRMARRGSGDKDEDEDEEMGEAQPESETEPESEPESESGPEPEPESGPETEGIFPGYEGEVGDASDSDSASDSASPAPPPVVPRRRLPMPPSPSATAPMVNAHVTAMGPDIMKMVNDLLSKERDEMKSSLRSFQEDVRFEMAKVQKRQDRLQEGQSRLQERQDRQDAAIKALAEAKTSQGQALDHLKQDLAATAKAIETASKEIRDLDGRIMPTGLPWTDDEDLRGRASQSPLPSTERSRSRSRSPPRPSSVAWKGSNLHFKAPKGWTPPMEAPMPPDKEDLWPSHRGSSISRHPLADCIGQPFQSALGRLMKDPI